MTKTILVPVEQKDLGNCFECGNALSVYCSYCNTPEAAPKPSIPADDREEVARAINELFLERSGYTVEEIADAAISTLQRLGWKEPGKEEG